MWRAGVAIGLGITVAGAVLAHTVFAQHPPASGPGQPQTHGSMPSHGSEMPAQHMTRPGAGGPPHHRLAEMCASAFEKNIGEGRGFGMAFVADQSGYPGPLHVLELQDGLKLTAEQDAKVQALLTAMFAESRPKSERLLEAERKLGRLFSEGRADEASIRTAAAEVERARSEVRLVHLMVHLKTRDVLTDEQRRLYHEARWSAHRPMGPQGGGSPGAGAPMR